MPSASDAAFHQRRVAAHKAEHHHADDRRAVREQRSNLRGVELSRSAIVPARRTSMSWTYVRASVYSGSGNTSRSTP
jgi:hypothetical protein